MTIYGPFEFMHEISASGVHTSWQALFYGIDKDLHSHHEIYILYLY